MGPRFGTADKPRMESGAATDDVRLTRQQFEELTNALMPLIARTFDDSALRSFKVPVGPVTSATVEFKGPVGGREYESLVAQLNVYKTFMPDDGGDRPMTLADMRDLLNRASEIVFGASASTNEEVRR